MEKQPIKEHPLIKALNKAMLTKEAVASCSLDGETQTFEENNSFASDMVDDKIFRNMKQQTEQEIKDSICECPCCHHDCEVARATLKGISLGRTQAISEFKENILMTKTNHQLGCMLECYQSIIENRIGFEKEAKQLLEIASKLK